MKRTIVFIVVVLCLAGIAIYQNNEKQNTMLTFSAHMKPKPDYIAPTLQLPDLSGMSIVIGGKRDKLLLVNFWASYCRPCEREAPYLQTLSKKYSEQLQIYGINATSYDKERQAREFVDQQKLTFPILMDRKGIALDLYKISSFPTSLLIDSEGIVRERITGIISEKKWETIIEKWIDLNDRQDQEISEQRQPIY
ncbi:thioredoxin [Paenibacillus baekrokdamisoli]|uniref:Thioredoxin n=1 Tax=Paenibacillus baekrokdamisoli TaxID=1712516 RepID=A0A3G9JP80_9BACL|nr:TlpA disulfide reductase family protein [Paenibacillus baekrokdamisoli]BBH24869.1 thioredoxin [Paenibacillus baekrokdamisoli]